MVVGVTVAVVAAGLTGGWLLWGRDGGDRTGARPPASASPSAGRQTPADTDGARGTDGAPGTSPAGPSPGTSGSAPSGTAAPVPEGYRLTRDSQGFTLAVPEDWTRSLEKDGVFYRSPDHRSLLQIFEITEPDITPYEALRLTSKNLAGNPGYEEITLEQIPGPETASESETASAPAPGSDTDSTDTGSPPAAQLVYAYDSEKLGVRCRVTDRAFGVPDGRQFAVLAGGPDADWPRQEEIQRIALQFFDASSTS
ncbi:hypothetical protein KGS77_12885 [Streptomyces sp. MST-110588]|nr:hypothetical protein KGS77_12885 [Streptomyces sp. MST-110588]